MPLDRTAVREHLRAFRFSELFTQELGWDWPNHPAIRIVIRTDGGNQAFDLTPVAHKRDVVAYRCPVIEHVDTIVVAHATPGGSLAAALAGVRLRGFTAWSEVANRTAVIYPEPRFLS